MASPYRVEKFQNEVRLNPALSAIQKYQFSCKRQAASTYNVSRTTLRQRNNDIQPKLESRAPNRLLLDCEEESLISWIHNMKRRGYPPHIINVRRMVQTLLARRDASSSPPTIGKH